MESLQRHTLISCARNGDVGRVQLHLEALARLSAPRASATQRVWRALRTLGRRRPLQPAQAGAGAGAGAGSVRGELDEALPLRRVVDWAEDVDADAAPPSDSLLDHHIGEGRLDEHSGGWSALHFAADRQDEAGAVIVELLVGAGARTDIENEQGERPLHLACDSGNNRSVLALLEGGAVASAPDKRGVNALHIAAKRGNVLIVEWLLRLRAVPANSITLANKSPLHYAIAGAFASKSGSLHCVELLLKAGALPSVADRSSRDTPLHVAARMGLRDVAFLLLDHGANLHKCNVDGDSAPRLAERYGYPLLARHMRKRWRVAYLILGALTDQRRNGQYRADIAPGYEGVAASRFLLAMSREDGGLPTDLIREIVRFL